MNRLAVKLLIVIILLIPLNGCAQKANVRFHYLGHSSFLIFFDEKISVLADYGKPNAWVNYGWDSPINDVSGLHPDLITYSHQHEDHYDTSRVKQFKSKIILDDGFTFNSLTIKTILTSEKDYKIPDNKSYLFLYRGLKILHLGDCQGNIIDIDSIENQKYIENNIPQDCDVLLIPIESTKKFIEQAERFIQLVRPKVVIPMHYWSLEYKKSFLEYLESTNKYRVVNCGINDYVYKKSKDEKLIEIIDIEPSKYIRK